MTKANEISIPTRNLDTIQPPTAGQPLSVYLAFMKTLAGEAVAWDRGKGRLSWLQGTALLHARKACQESGKAGAWGKFLGSIGMKETTAKYCRKIAETIGEEESHTLGYVEMLARSYPSYAKMLRDEVDAENGTKVKRTRKPKSSPDDESLAAWTVKNLTVAVKSVQETTSHIQGKDLPERFDDKVRDDMRRLLKEAQNELASVAETVERWARMLDSTEPVLVITQSETESEAA